MNIFQLEERINENPDSPLTVRLAAQYLIRGRIQDAVNLSLKGIEHYPDYATSFIVLARCYAALRCFEEAIFCANKALTLQPDSFIIKNLINNWTKFSSEEVNQSESLQQLNIPDKNKLKTILYSEISLTDLPAKEKSTPQDIELVPESIEKLEIKNEAESDEGETTIQLTEEPLENQFPETTDEKEINIIQIEEQIANETLIENETFSSKTDEQIFEKEKLANYEVQENIDKNLENQEHFDEQKALNNALYQILQEQEKQIEIQDPDNTKLSEQLELADPTQISIEAYVEIDDSVLIEQSQTDIITESENKLLDEEHSDIPLEDLVGKEKSEIQPEIESISTGEFGEQIGVNTEEIVSEIEQTEYSQETQSINADVQEDTQPEIAKIKEETSKSDEHITKIFETAQDSLKREGQSEDNQFNHGPIEELPKIVSATLAEIYVRQGQFEEAIKTYKALIKLRPKQKDYFERKIQELEKRLKSLF